MKTKAIICDLDGTLCLFPGKNPYSRDFINDVVNEPVRTILRALHHNHYILLTSGRSIAYKSETESWLLNNNIAWNRLFMRPIGDNRPDEMVKAEFYDDYIKDIYPVDFVLDDRDKIVKMWRKFGLTCLQVAEGNF